MAGVHGSQPHVWRPDHRRHRGTVRVVIGEDLRLFITEKAVSKHAAGIFGRLELALSEDDNRRVLAILAYLDT